MSVADNPYPAPHARISSRSIVSIEHLSVTDFTFFTNKSLWGPTFSISPVQWSAIRDNAPAAIARIISGRSSLEILLTSRSIHLLINSRLRGSLLSFRQKEYSLSGLASSVYLNISEMISYGKYIPDEREVPVSIASPHV